MINPRLASNRLGAKGRLELYPRINADLAGRARPSSESFATAQGRHPPRASRVSKPRRPFRFVPRHRLICGVPRRTPALHSHRRDPHEARSGPSRSSSPARASWRTTEPVSIETLSGMIYNGLVRQETARQVELHHRPDRTELSFGATSKRLAARKSPSCRRIGQATFAARTGRLVEFLRRASTVLHTRPRFLSLLPRRSRHALLPLNRSCKPSLPRLAGR